MNQTVIFAAAGVLAAGLVGGAVAVRPASQDAQGAQGAVAAAVAPFQNRIATLEDAVAQAAREREAAERQIAEAMSVAIESKRDLEKMQRRMDDVLAMLDGVQGAGLASNASAKPVAAGADPSLAAPVDGAAPAPVLAAGPPPLTGSSQPGEVAAVRKALEQIKKEDDDRERAEREARRQEQMNRRLDNLEQKLGLQPGQKDAIATIWAESAEKSRALMESIRQNGGGFGGGAGGGDRGAMREQMTAVRAESDKKIQEILTPAQYAEYQKIEDEDRPGGRGGNQAGGGRRGGRGGAP